MAEGIKINIDADTRSLSDVQKELRAIKSEMIGLEGDAFTDAAMRAAELETEIKRANAAVRELSGSGDQLPRMAKSIGGIGKSLATLDFTAANEGAQRMLFISQNMNFGTAIKSLKQLGSTFVNLGKALLTNPFFLMVAVIAAIGVALYKLMDELGLLQVIMDAVGKVFEWIMIPINALIDGLKALTDWFGWTNHAGEEFAEGEIENINEVSDEFKKLSNDKISQFDHEIAIARANGEETEEIERKKLIFKEKAIEMELKMAERKAEHLITLHGEDSEEVKAQLKAIEDIKTARIAASRETELFEVKAAADRKKAAEKEAEDERKRLEKAGADARRIREQREKERQRELEAEKKLQEDIAKAQLNAQKMIDEQNLKFIEDEIERSRELALFKEQQAWEDLDRTHLTNEQIEILEEQHQQRLIDIQANADEQVRLREEAKREEEAKRREEELAEAQKLADEKVRIEEERVKLEEELEKQKKDGITSTSKDLLGAIQDNAEEGSAIAKAAAVSQATIDTYKAAQGAYSAMAGIPVIGPGLGIAAAAAAVAAGVANVRGILSTPTPGGGGGGGSAPSISTASANNVVTPQFQMFGQANETGASSSDFGGVERGGNQENQQPIRAYVQWSDIDETGNNDANLKNEMQL